MQDDHKPPTSSWVSTGSCMGQSQSRIVMINDMFTFLGTITLKTVHSRPFYIARGSSSKYAQFLLNASKSRMQTEAALPQQWNRGRWHS